MQPLSTETNAL